jgi:hypothetical protein
LNWNVSNHVWALFVAAKFDKLFGFPIFRLWSLFKKRVVCIKFDTHAFISPFLKTKLTIFVINNSLRWVFLMHWNLMKNIWNMHFLALFGWVYIRNGKRLEKIHRYTTGSSQHVEIMYYRLFNQGMKKSLKIPKMVIRSRNGNIDKLVKRYRYIGMMMVVFIVLWLTLI